MGYRVGNNWLQKAKGVKIAVELAKRALRGSKIRKSAIFLIKYDTIRPKNWQIADFLILDPLRALFANSTAIFAPLVPNS